MENIQQHIASFIAQQSLATICCSGPEGELHCFSCYYAYSDLEELLFIKTPESSTHMQYLLENPVLAGTIVPDKLNKLVTKGIQFNGHLLTGSQAHAHEASKKYYKRYPFAVAMSGTIYTIRLDRLKMTDSTLGIGTRLIWDRLHSPLLKA